MEFTQNGEKLIRHLIPAEPTRIVEGDEHVQFLKWKIAEEAGEVATSNAETFAAELADVRQALSDFLAVTGIKLSQLRTTAPEDGPPETAEKIRYFRSLIDQLAALAGAVPDDDIDRIDHVSSMLQVIVTLAHIAGKRDAVRSEMAKKLAELGDFAHGVVWQAHEK